MPDLLGCEPLHVVAMCWSDEEGWVQVPVQVDERAVVPWLQIYNDFQPPWETPLLPTDTILTWCDSSTFTGADPNPSLDANDEIALLAEDAGTRAPAGESLPMGTTGEGATELMLVDPLDGSLGWLYLLRHDGTLDPSAGQDRVDYDFKLASGLSYLEGYVILDSINPELTTVESPGVWRASFSDRWIRDGLWVEHGVMLSTDLLDRHRTTSGAPGCTRSEDTFSGYTLNASEGAFLANIDGPVRALRSLVGANSGVITQRDHVFWPRREDLTTRLRVHPLDEQPEDVFDLELSALGAVSLRRGPCQALSSTAIRMGIPSHRERHLPGRW